MKLIILTATLFATVFSTNFKNTESGYGKVKGSSKQLRTILEKGKIKNYELKMRKSYYPEY